MKQVLLIVAAIAAIAFFSGGFTGDTEAAPDMKSKIIHALTLTPVDGPEPAPAVKVKRADCTVCRGTGRVKTGDGLSTTECENCVAGQTITVDVSAEVKGPTKDCTCDPCECEDCRCVPEPVVNSYDVSMGYTDHRAYEVAIGGGDLLNRIVPRRTSAAATCAPGSACAAAAAANSSSGNCASGSCGTSSASVRSSGGRFTPVRRMGGIIRNRPRLFGRR